MNLIRIVADMIKERLSPETKMIVTHKDWYSLFSYEEIRFCSIYRKNTNTIVVRNPLSIDYMLESKPISDPSSNPQEFADHAAKTINKVIERRKHVLRKRIT